ncbi:MULTISPECIES: hypothetical protein [Streptomyces]|uniref:hypothetical protein n=1 Tax=Streptomyces TaxID=1883 RepID=UPI00163B626F|nr:MULTISPECIES: hypothetical protein [Streptomyces]MBC2873960.1 hypothetical protein [Streptomyces sp. TYQ1024]UBI39097.1 hypothetical protein K7I03_23350 [Streptomyces mobaraensis]UKW31676.1 hypothetical protein MCU78_23295 [Streptomyces sp. TYQ1024]
MSTPAPIRVLRGTDLLDLSFGFVGLKFDDRPGSRRLVRADPQQDGLLVVTLGPQHVTEHALLEEGTDPDPRDAPVGSLVSGRSVLVFEVGAQDAVGYSEAGLLAAMRVLPLRVVDAAREADPAVVAVRPPPGAEADGAGGASGTGPEGADGAGVRGGAEADGDATDRALALVRLLRTTAQLTARYGVDATLAAAAEAAGAPPVPRTPENPLADPAHPRTGIELPYRLLLSPPGQARWIHRDAVDDPGPGERVALWHTRLSGGTVRAVWNRDRDPGTPAPEVTRLPLTPRDRTDLVDLTAHDGLSTVEGKPFTPLPVRARTLMLSALGGWLESVGQWPERPAGIDLSDWRQHTTLGRDHYVRVMHEGYLCPFGHRAAVVTVTERKFKDPRTAFLFQRFYVLVRQPLRTYDPGRPLPAKDGDPAADLTNLLFPFTSVRLDTLVTPNLVHLPDPPTSASFFPATATEDPFLFKATAVDHQGRIIEFRTPLLFVPEHLSRGDRLAAVLAEYNRPSLPPVPAPDGSRTAATVDPPTFTSAALLGQSVALAPPVKPDDTSVDVAHLVWAAAAPPALAVPDPAHPAPGEAQFIPQLSWATAAVPAVGALTGGGAAAVPVTYARRYALSGFAAATQGARKGNPGEVFLSLLHTGAPALAMDFGSQRDRSGALVAPSFDIAGLSRATGPVSGTGPVATAVDRIAGGEFDPADFFGTLDINFLGVLSLADVIRHILPGDPLPALHVPNFITQTVSSVTGFLTDLRRVRDLADNAAPGLPPAARQVADTARRLAELVAAYLAEHLSHPSLPTAVPLTGGSPAAGPAAGTGPPAAAAPPTGPPPPSAAPSTSTPPPSTAPAAGPPVTLQQIDDAFAAFSTALTSLLTSLPATADPGLRTLLTRVREQADTWTTAAGQLPSLRDALQQAARGLKLPETVSTRIEWSPQIKPWPDTGDPVFVPHTEGTRTVGRLSLVVDLRGSLRPDVSSGADVTCSLEKFDLVLIPSFQAMRLTFDRVRFRMRAGEKPDIDVGFRKVEFIGPLSFVETLRQLIPIDGFSDPPGIQVTTAGITARYGIPLPNLAVGVFSLENIRLDAYLDLPFIGRPLEIGFSFCSRQAPFRLTVSLLGGGGFFGIVITPKHVAVLEAALEFGAAVSMNLGVASGSLSVMAGIYFRLELATSECRITGYFRARGEVDVLGIVSASIELLLELTYDSGSGTVYGRARISISVHIGFWSQSVTIECEKRFLGAGHSPSPLSASDDAVRPPTFAQMMAPYPDPVTGLPRDPVDEYCTAFAEVS